MVMKRPPVMIPLCGKVPGRAQEPSRTRVDDDGGCRTFRGILLGCLGFSRGCEYIGEGARGALPYGVANPWAPSWSPSDSVFFRV